MHVEAEITAEIRLIDELLGKEDYSNALHHAKKLASAHYQSKRATEMLLKVQKKYDKYEKNEKTDVSQKKIDRFLREAGVRPEAMQEQKKVEEHNKKPFVFLEKYREILTYLKKRQEERQRYLKNQQDLQRLEQMLLESGSITKITNEGGEEDVLTIMESGLTKDISDFRLDGYNFYGKIIGKDKIVGDTFGCYRNGTKTIYYFGDATGHGVQAGFTVSMLTKIFFEQTKKISNFVELYQKINNELKMKLKGRVFVTAVLFEHDSSNGSIHFLGAGHDPMYIYRHASGKVEKIIPGGLALGVRLINNVSSLKPKPFLLDEHDMIIGYTDGIIESRNAQGEFYGLARLEKAIEKYAPRAAGNPSRLYERIYADVCEFQGKETFLDDVSIFVFERDPNKDLIANKDELDVLLKDLDISDRTVKIDFKGKTREEILEQMQRKRHESELKARMAILEQLYKLGEYSRLKQEITVCYKQGFIHEKMQFFLKKIIKNEEKNKTLKLEDRLQKKYEMLKDLYDKGEYAVVIRETVDVLYKNGNI